MACKIGESLGQEYPAKSVGKWSNHLREWLFHSRTGVGVRNSSGVGVWKEVGENNLSRVDLGVDFYCLNFALALASNTIVNKVYYKTDVYDIYIWRTGILKLAFH
jgi:hypothetical protein